jgi:hypothetical protein
MAQFCSRLLCLAIFNRYLLISDVVGEGIVQAETNLQAERKIGPNWTFANSITLLRGYVKSLDGSFAR